MSESANLSLETGVNSQSENEIYMKQQLCSSPWKGHLKQAMVIIGMNLHSLSVGTALGFPTIALSDFSAVNASAKVRDGRPQEYQFSIEDEGKIFSGKDQASWFGSISVTSVLLGSLVASAVQPRFGRRTALVIANIFLASAWSLSSVAQQPTLILASTVVASLYAGSMVAPLLVYQSETLTPHFLRKPILLSLTHISLLMGFIIEMALGAKLGWRTVAAINTAFPGICLLILLSLPESPAILRQRKQTSDSTAVFRWLRGIYLPEDKRKHDSVISQQVSVTRKNPRLRSIGLLIASLCYHHLCGMTVVRTYSVPLLESLSKREIPSYIHEFPIILGCFQICGFAVGLTFRRWTDRSCRLPILLSAFLGSIGCNLALGLYCHFFIHKLPPLYPGINIASAIPSWLPTVLLGIFSFCSCMSIPLVPYSFAGEFFPSFATGFPSRLALFLSCICCFSCNKLFFLTLGFIGLRGFFWAYAITGSICSGVICVLLPRDLGCTKGESTESLWHEMDDDLVETWMENSSVTNSVEKSKNFTESQGDSNSYNHSRKEIDTYRRENKVAPTTAVIDDPDWLGDISWADCHGGWLVEEMRRGGWKVLERGYGHRGGRRGMNVEEGTWIGHMLKVVTSATIDEENKDFSKWKLANQARKCWIITKGPNNQWQICSAPWESETTEESEDGSDENDSSGGSNYSDEQRSSSLTSDENKSTERNTEAASNNTVESKETSHINIHLRYRRSFEEYIPKNKFRNCAYKRSSSLDPSNDMNDMNEK